MNRAARLIRRWLLPAALCASLVVTGNALSRGATVSASSRTAARPPAALLSVVGNLAAITVSGAKFRPWAQLAIRVYLRADSNSSWAVVGRCRARSAR